jgi:tetratricopeptide (TPR) repeat protein
MTRQAIDFSRRNFFLRCCQVAPATLIPRSIWRAALLPRLIVRNESDADLLSADYRLTPHYRAQAPLDSVLPKTQAGHDDFISEKYADQIEAILAKWTVSLKRSSGKLQALEDTLAPTFLASPVRPADVCCLRSGPGIEIFRSQFSNAPLMGREQFIRDFTTLIGPLSEVLTAEFQVTDIEVNSEASPIFHAPTTIRTEVRYDLVGSGSDFFREERVGYWDLEWETTDSGEPRLCRWRALRETCSRAASPVFVDITSVAMAGNASYQSQLLRGSDYWRTVLDGACGIDVYGHNGIAVGDFNNDGFDDVYVCQPAGLPNRLYRNRGDGTFEDVTEASGLAVLENTSCALFADFDNDGRQDLLVVRSSGPWLFLNQGDGTFQLKPNAFRFAHTPQGTFTGAAVADYDRDGRLDVYFCLYLFHQGVGQYQYPLPYHDAQNGPPNFLMHNNGDGTFTDATEGINQNNNRYSFCCAWSDYNQDGWPDLYVVNDFGRKNLYRNNGDGTFTDVAGDAGVDDVGAGMGVCWLDFDNDGREDVYVANMWSSAGRRVAAQNVFMPGVPEKVLAMYRKHACGNSLFHNEGDGRFLESTETAGVGMGRWAWSTDSWDFDHDGFPDLYVTNGMISGPSPHDLSSFFWRQVVAQAPLKAKPAQDYEQGWSALNELIRSDGTLSGFERNVFYANNRDGTFSDVSGTVGLDFLEDSRAFALSDFDHDGRLEVFLKNRNGPQLRILRNETSGIGQSVAFRLSGRKSNRDGIGTVITLETRDSRQTKSLQAGSGFLSQHTKDVFFGLGDAPSPVRATIRWPSGLVQVFSDLPAGHRVLVQEGSAEFRTEPFRTRATTNNRPPLQSVRQLENLPSKFGTWLLAPVTAPDFSLPDLSGTVQSLSGLHGRHVLLNFWATRAAPCATELGVFNRVYSRWAAQGLELVSFNVNDTSDAATVRAYAREHGLSFPIVMGAEDTTGIYNLLYRYLFDRHRNLGIPSSFLIDEQGAIVKVYQGPVDPQQVEKDFRSIPSSAEERLKMALPFPGVTDVNEFRRNYLTYGFVYFNRGFIVQAAEAFGLALRDDPQSAEAYYGLGSVHLKMHRSDDARQSFESALKFQPHYPDTWTNAWNNLGVIAMQAGRSEDAVKNFQAAVRQNPKNLVALDNLGNAFRQQERWAEAREALGRALQLNPDDAEANYSMGMVFARLDDAKGTYEYLQKALAIRPDYPEALNNLAILYLRTGRLNDGITSFKECIRLAPDFDEAYLNLAKVYVLESEPANARDVLQQLLRLHPDHPMAQKALAELPGSKLAGSTGPGNKDGHF